MDYNSFMEIGVEISLYPLADEFVPEIHDFLARLGAAHDLKIVTTSLSTQVFGEYDRVFDALRRELHATLESRRRQGGKAAFVLKVLGPLWRSEVAAARGRRQTRRLALCLGTGEKR